VAVERHEHPIGCLTVFFMVYIVMGGCQISELQIANSYRACEIEECQKRIQRLEELERARTYTEATRPYTVEKK
jgi:hypothetical protein